MGAPLRRSCSSKMAPRQAWCFMVVLLVGTASMGLAEEGASDDGELISTGAGAAGRQLLQKFPAQEMQEKAGDIERSYLARQTVIAGEKKQKWDYKVQKVKINRISDHVMEVKNKNLKLRTIRTTERMAKAARVEKAESDLAAANKKTHDDMVNKGLAMESSQKAGTALNVAIKKTEELRDGKSKAAEADRTAVTGILAKLRIAKAHADGDIVGLTDHQKTEIPVVMLHNAVENMVGKQTDKSVLLARGALQRNAAYVAERNQKSIVGLHQQHEKKVEEESSNKKEGDTKLKLKKEISQKKATEKDGKKIEEVNRQLELPGKKIKEGWGKKEASLIRGNWMARQQRITDEIAVKGTFKTEHLQMVEKSEKKQAGEEKAFLQQSCGALMTKKTETLEIRTKKIDAFGMARDHVVVAQDMIKAKKVDDEKGLKDSLKKAEEAAKTKESEMQEANQKAAEADTDMRNCGGSMLRRRRTCACDDPPAGIGREEEEEEDELGETSETAPLEAYERRRYVRRRYQEPNPADRRRAYSGPGSGSEAPRMPGKVCPCCPPNQKPKTTACMVAEAQAAAAEAQAANTWDSNNRL